MRETYYDRFSLCLLDSRTLPAFRRVSFLGWPGLRFLFLFLAVRPVFLP